MINISSYNFQFFQNILTYTWISPFVKYPCATPPHHTHVQSLQFRTLLIDNDYSSAAKCRRADLSDRPGFRDFSRFLAALDELVPRRGLNRTAIRIVSSYLSLPIREKEKERRRRNIAVCRPIVRGNFSYSGSIRGRASAVASSLH